MRKDERKLMQTQEERAQEPVRWGILSAANIGARAVAPAIQASSNGRLVAVGSRNRQKATQLYTFADKIQLYKSYDEVISDPEIEAIYIPLPNGLHSEWSIKAMQAGKHVLCEKPLSIIVREGAKMGEVARERQVLLMEAFMYRFHPQTAWMLEQVRTGVIGAVRLVRSSFSFDIREDEDNIRLQPELAGGALMDIGCYGVNICRAIFGHSPRAVAARAAVPNLASVDMAMNAVLDYGEGRFGLIDCSFLLPMRQGVEIVGEEGTITMPVPFTPGNTEATVFLTKNGKMSEQQFPRVDQYQLEVEHFAACIRSGREPALTLHETLENIATIEAIFEAAGMDWPLV